MKNDILTPRLVAEELGVNHATACTWCAKGWLKAKKVDGNWKITKEDLETFKKEHKQGHKREPKRGHKKGKGITINSNPKTKRPKLSENVLEVHARADEMVRDRQKILAELFPHPKPGEVYNFVLYNMEPKGLSHTPTLEELMNEELKKEQKPERQEPDGELGAKLAQAEYDLLEMMDHESASVQIFAQYLYKRLQKVLSENRGRIKDYAESQEQSKNNLSDS